MTDTKMNIQAFLDKNASEIDKKLTTFEESAALFSSNKPRFIDQYENKWVAAHDGEVVAVADTLEHIMTMIDAAGVRVNETMIRHIDREEKTLIM
jgi:hypothetical protein